MVEVLGVKMPIERTECYSSYYDCDVIYLKYSQVTGEHKKGDRQAIRFVWSRNEDGSPKDYRWDLGICTGTSFWSNPYRISRAQEGDDDYDKDNLSEEEVLAYVEHGVMPKSYEGFKRHKVSLIDQLKTLKDED